MKYSRNNPSPRYRDLMDQYCLMHAKGETFLQIPPEQTFPGLSLPPQAARIKRLIDLTQAATLLDYGSGKGQQYDETNVFRAPDGSLHDSILDYWDIVGVYCYDPCYPPFSKLPTNRFDGVVSTDVLEHCPEQDIPWIIEEIFGFADLFVFANVACYPARKRLPNGENAHTTIRSPSWWEEILIQTARQHPGIVWEAWIQTAEETPDGRKLIETRLGSENPGEQT